MQCNKIAANISAVKNAPPPGGHIFQATGTIFKLVQDIIGTNLLTKFHDDRAINMGSRVLTRKNAPPPPGGHVFKATEIIFKLIQDIIGTNLLTKFHEDRKINVASKVHIGKNAPPPGGHVFQPTCIIFELVQDIIGMNLLTKCHEDLTINVASRVLTRFYYSHIRKNAPPLGSHVFQANTNLLTKFHEDWTINVASRVLTRKTAPPPWNTAPPPGGHLHEDWASNVTSTVFTSFELSRGINGTNVLTKLHKDQTINVASRVFTRQNVDDVRRTTDHGQKAITKAHHEHVVLRTNVLTKVLTRFYYSHKKINSRPPGCHVFNRPEPFSN
ncbi:hypothetical protein DPMN_109369 [Dreissena polymorpha]|uniref:Uncharacterized protein n=1 Tax=Dreissena polymorpha TaxID=45954 RepID=A0A9D4KA56_DREPO|nr:hypothetical protein DPMN_109369 [Dreissena polymorpha]